MYYVHINEISCQHRSANYWGGQAFGEETSTRCGIDPVLETNFIFDTWLKNLYYKKAFCRLKTHSSKHVTILCTIFSIE